jgi:hypothetical protein
LNTRDFKEKIIVSATFTGIFLPIRLFFFTYVSQFWLGSFGIMSVVLLIIMYLSRKGKLGYLGRIIDKQIMSFSKGRYGKLSLVYLIFTIYLYSLFIYGASYVPPETKDIITSQLAEQGITDMESASQAENVGWSGPGASWGVLFSLVIILIPNKIGFALFSIINDWTDGWMVHFSMVLLVESLEILGLVLYFRYKKKA